MDSLGETAAETAEAAFEGLQVQSSSNVPQADEPIQQQTSQATTTHSVADDAVRSKAVKSGQADSAEDTKQHEVDLAQARYVNATVLEQKEVADAHAAKARLQQETILAAFAANKSAASQVAASAAKAQFEAAEDIKEKQSAAAAAARARYANATLLEEKESGAAKAAEKRYDQKKANLIANATIKAAASQLALVMEKARLKSKERIEEEKSAAADAARASYANATLFEQKEAGAAKASKVRYEQEEAVLLAMAANKSAASQAELVGAKAQLMRQERIEEEKSAAADEAKAKAIASEQKALRKTAAAQLAAEAARARYANATRIEQEEAAKVRDAKTTDARAAAKSASVDAASAQILATANMDLHFAQQQQIHAVQMEAKAADIRAKALHELADAQWWQPFNLLPWLLVALMSPYVICQGVWRLFRGTSNDKPLLETELLKGSPCNYLPLGSHLKAKVQADLAMEANLKNKGNPYQHDVEDVKTCNLTDPEAMSRGETYVPPPLFPLDSKATDPSKALSSVHRLEKTMTSCQGPPLPYPRSAYLTPPKDPSNNPYFQRIPHTCWSPSALGASFSCASHRGITPELLVPGNLPKNVSGRKVPEYYIGC